MVKCKDKESNEIPANFLIILVRFSEIVSRFSLYKNNSIIEA